MQLNKYLDVINACRFCFMCRHLSTLGLVTASEADIPRGHALIADRIRMNPDNLKNPDFIDTFFRADMSGACRTHCVSSYNETGLVAAIRQDIVEAGLAPQPVKDLCVSLRNAQFRISGKADVLYYPHPCVEMHQPEIAAAFQALCPEAAVLNGGDCGKALSILGFKKDAMDVAARFTDVVRASGCNTLVLSAPSAFDFLKTEVPIDGVNVILTSEYLLGKKLPQTPAPRQVAFIDSDFLRFYQKCDAPSRLLQALGYELTPFGTNPEESYACGEGSMPIIQLYPELVRKMVQRVADIATTTHAETIATASPYTKYALKLFAPTLNVITPEEAANTL